MLSKLLLPLVSVQNSAVLDTYSMLGKRIFRFCYNFFTLKINVLTQKLGDDIMILNSR